MLFKFIFIVGVTAAAYFMTKKSAEENQDSGMAGIIALVVFILLVILVGPADI
jgi:amino acid transporter